MFTLLCLEHFLYKLIKNSTNKEQFSSITKDGMRKSMFFHFKNVVLVLQIIFYRQFSQSLKVFYYTLCMQTTLPPEVHSWNNYDNLCIRFDKAQELGKKEKTLAH